MNTTKPIALATGRLPGGSARRAARPRWPHRHLHPRDPRDAAVVKDSLRNLSYYPLEPPVLFRVLHDLVVRLHKFLAEIGGGKASRPFFSNPVPVGGGGQDEGPHTAL